MTNPVYMHLPQGAIPTGTGSIQEWTEEHPCPACGGGTWLPKGTGQRCHGFLFSSGRAFACSREERSEHCRNLGDGLFVHQLFQLCICGLRHAEPTALIRSAQQEAEEEAKLDYARQIWRETLPVAGTQAQRYLAARGITLSLPESLRFSKSVAHPSGFSFPAMVARVSSLDLESDLFAIHRTYLYRDGTPTKAPVEPQKAMLASTRGGCVQLGPYAHGTGYVIGEGIESTLSAMQLMGLPGCATMSATGMKLVAVPFYMGDLVIAVDNDDTGRSVGEALRARLLADPNHPHRKVTVVTPKGEGNDFNDILREGGTWN